MGKGVTIELVAARALGSGTLQRLDPALHLWIVDIPEQQINDRQGDYQRQEADAHIGHSPANRVNQGRGVDFCQRATDTGAHQGHTQRQAAFVLEPPGDCLGIGDGQGARTHKGEHRPEEKVQGQTAVVEGKGHHAQGEQQNGYQGHLPNPEAVGQVAGKRRADHRGQAERHQSVHDLVNAPAKLLTQGLGKNPDGIEGQRRHPQGDAQAARQHHRPAILELNKI